MAVLLCHPSRAAGARTRTTPQTSHNCSTPRNFRNMSRGITVIQSWTLLSRLWVLQHLSCQYALFKDCLVCANIHQRTAVGLATDVIQQPQTVAPISIITIALCHIPARITPTPTSHHCRNVYKDSPATHCTSRNNHQFINNLSNHIIHVSTHISHRPSTVT